MPDVDKVDLSRKPLIANQLRGHNSLLVTTAGPTTLEDNPFQSLDFLYIPTRDVAKDAADLTGVLGGRPIFAVDDGNTRVAMIALTPDPPHLLLTDHLEGERPILIYRVDDLDTAVALVKEAGWTSGEVFEIPHGPCCSFQAPGGHRIAIYQPSRPQATSFFEGRFDF
jgi:hypothetical protein